MAWFASTCGQGRAGQAARQPNLAFSLWQAATEQRSGSQPASIRRHALTSASMPQPALSCLRVQALERQQREYDLHAPAAAVHKVACTVRRGGIAGTGMLVAGGLLAGAAHK